MTDGHPDTKIGPEIPGSDKNPNANKLSWVINYLSVSQGTFTFDIQRATLKTCDLWDTWSDWWGNMTWQAFTSLFFWKFLTILTIQGQSWRLATLETLITILTIENLNSDHLWDLAIKSDAGQHLQFFRCLWRWALKYYNKVPFTFSIFMYFRNKLNFYWFSFFRYSFKFSKTKLTLLMWPWHVMMVWQN